MWTMFIYLMVSFPLLLECQLYFPDDNGGFMQMTPENSEYLPSFQPNSPSIKNLTALRGTSEYEKRVDAIISSGILKLAVAIEKTLLQTTSGNYENIVTAPVSIAGVLMILILSPKYDKLF